MIISVSRRTDIPAYYSSWFMNRVRDGFCMTRNPFNANQVRRVSLRVEDVDAFVFWTRNPAPLFGHLAELDDLGFAYYFQMTITGYPRALESKTPSLEQALDRFQALSQRLGKGRVIWRYDPVLVSNMTDVDDHLARFDRIAAALNGSCERVVVSMADFYAKTERNLKRVDGLHYEDIRKKPDDLARLSAGFVKSAQKNGMTIQSCAEEADLEPFQIGRGKCIDAQLLNDLFALDLNLKKDKGQRQACGCVPSIDIGAYNSCLHGCVYCYATFNRTQAQNVYARHDPTSPFLIP